MLPCISCPSSQIQLLPLPQTFSTCTTTSTLDTTVYNTPLQHLLFSSVLLTVQYPLQFVKALRSGVSLAVDDPGWECLNLGILALLCQIIKLHDNPVV